VVHEDHRYLLIARIDRDHDDPDEKVTKEANAGPEAGARTKKSHPDEPLRSITSA
jgi:hypothetical protein